MTPLGNFVRARDAQRGARNVGHGMWRTRNVENGMWRTECGEHGIMNGFPTLARFCAASRVPHCVCRIPCAALPHKTV